MIDRDSPVTEEELHVFVDGELPEDRRAAVEAWLATHPEDAARVAAWRAQTEAIRTRYAGVLNELVPPHLSIKRLTRNSRSWLSMAAAALVAFSIGGVTGWMARGASATAQTSFELFTNDALAAHRLFTAEVRHPIEVTAKENHLIPWLSRRVGTNLRAPELDRFGLKLLGGRLLPGPNGPAALFMYEGATGERFTLYCSRAKGQQTAFRYNLADHVAAVHWIEGETGWVVSGPADRERLSNIAQAAYEQLENRAPRERSSADQLISRRGS